MRGFVLLLLAAALACSPDSPDPYEGTDLMAPVFSAAKSADHFKAHATGDNERPTPNDSRAQGQALFRLSEDETELHFKLIVANILNVTQAHIHLGPVEGTGGIVVWLYPSGPPAELIPGRTQGILGEGTITDADLVGALAGMSLEDLVAAIRAGNTYVNVHTNQFPLGEIRGQIH